MPSPPRRDVAREVSACASALSVQLATALAENVNVKSVHRKLSSFSRMLITITFAEDAWRMVSDYAVQVRTMDELVEHGTNLVPAPLTRAMPAVSAALQIYGVAAVVTERQPTRGAAVLLCWCVLHPFVYGQGSNILFLAETVTVTGGLLILLAHWRQGQQREVARASNGADHRTAELGDDTLTSVLHLAGRVCVSCYFVVYGLLKLQSTLSGTRTVLSLPVGLVHGCLMVVLCYMSLLLIVGSKSRCGPRARRASRPPPSPPAPATPFHPRPSLRAPICAACRHAPSTRRRRVALLLSAIMFAYAHVARHRPLRASPCRALTPRAPGAAWQYKSLLASILDATRRRCKQRARAQPAPPQHRAQWRRRRAGWPGRGGCASGERL